MASVFVAVTQAAEYRGVVTGAGVPIPGATITASRADQQIVTTTDQAGVFRFSDLDDGQWTIRVEMLGFASQTQDIAVASGVEPVKWALTLKSVEELIGS